VRGVSEYENPGDRHSRMIARPAGPTRLLQSPHRASAHWARSTRPGPLGGQPI
jgi:hypothetical protein